MREKSLFPMNQFPIMINKKIMNKIGRKGLAVWNNCKVERRSQAAEGEDNNSNSYEYYVNCGYTNEM